MQETETIFERILKEEFETTKTKWVERMEACLAVNGRHFEKENVKYMASDSDDDPSE